MDSQTSPTGTIAASHQHRLVLISSLRVWLDSGRSHDIILARKRALSVSQSVVCAVRSPLRGSTTSSTGRLSRVYPSPGRGGRAIDGRVPSGSGRGSPCGLSAPTYLDNLRLGVVRLRRIFSLLRGSRPASFRRGIAASHQAGLSSPPPTLRAPE